jgi:hypothetical protein
LTTHSAPATYRYQTLTVRGSRPNAHRVGEERGCAVDAAHGDDARARFAHRQSDAQADAAGAAGDERADSREVDAQGCLSLSWTAVVA